MTKINIKYQASVVYTWAKFMKTSGLRTKVKFVSYIFGHNLLSLWGIETWVTTITNNKKITVVKTDIAIMSTDSALLEVSKQESFHNSCVNSKLV